VVGHNTAPNYFNIGNSLEIFKELLINEFKFDLRIINNSNH
jgi:hypothetical protein